MKRQCLLQRCTGYSAVTAALLLAADCSPATRHVTAVQTVCTRRLPRGAGQLRAATRHRRLAQAR